MTKKSREKKIVAITKKIEDLKEKLQNLEYANINLPRLSSWYYFGRKDDFQKRLNVLCLELEKLENWEVDETNEK